MIVLLRFPSSKYAAVLNAISDGGFVYHERFTQAHPAQGEVIDPVTELEVELLDQTIDDLRLYLKNGGVLDTCTIEKL